MFWPRLPPDEIELACTFDKDTQSLSILGLCWIPHNDVVTFLVQEFLGALSKRTILSYTIRIFYLLDFLAPPPSPPPGGTFNVDTSSEIVDWDNPPSCRDYCKID